MVDCNYENPEGFYHGRPEPKIVSLSQDCCLYTDNLELWANCLYPQEIRMGMFEIESILKGSYGNLARNEILVNLPDQQFEKIISEELYLPTFDYAINPVEKKNLLKVVFRNSPTHQDSIDKMVRCGTGCAILIFDHMYGVEGKNSSEWFSFQRKANRLFWEILGHNAYYERLTDPGDHQTRYYHYILNVIPKPKR